jgi:hypothetical protein
MRIVLLLAIASLCAAADAPPKGDAAKIPDFSPPSVVHSVTADDLQNLVVCARRSLPTLTADELGAVAVSIKHAEEAIVAMRQPPAAPAEKPPAPKP